MHGELKKIKKKYGEEMAHFCRENFSSILETEGLLFEILNKRFEPTTRLYDDLCNNELVDEFITFIYRQLNPKQEEVKSTKDPFSLMKEVGYTLYECQCEKDIKRFKKYYAKGEELCTFNGNRLEKCYVFFAVKDGAELLERNSFNNPKREDEYGTSVISIQFTKSNTNMVSIKNRYNHTVANPDATFSNDLDTIVPGLRYSFSHYYNFNIPSFPQYLSIPGYILGAEGKYYRFNYEIDGVYYCANNIIIDDWHTIWFDPSRYLLIDSYLFDLENKCLVEEHSTTGLSKALQDIQKIDIVKESDYKLITITLPRGEVIIMVDLDNMIIGYQDDYIEILPNDFLMYNESIETAYFGNVKGIGNNVLRYNAMLQELELPNCISIGSNFLKQNLLLTDLSCPSLRKIGSNFLQNNICLEQCYMPLLSNIGPGFLASHKNSDKIYAPNLPKEQIKPSEDEYILTLMKK